jgi:hypothetical protein
MADWACLSLINGTADASIALHRPPIAGSATAVQGRRGRAKACSSLNGRADASDGVHRPLIAGSAMTVQGRRVRAAATADAS